MPKKWSKELITSEIKRLRRIGSPLNSNYVQKKCVPLYQAACVYFGSWRLAIETAGFAYDDVRILEHFRPVWSREKVIAAIKKRYRSNLPLNSNYVQTKESALYGAANKYWGGWKQAVEAANIDYEKLRQKRLNYSQQEVLEFIVSMFETGEAINAGEISRSHHGIYNAARRWWGSWDAALQKVGIIPELVREKHAPRSREGVLNEIQRLAELGEPLSYKFVMRNHNGLIQSASRLFGSWEGAVNTAGFRYEDHCRVQRWSPEKVIRAIQDRAYQGLPNNAAVLQRSDGSSLYGAGCRYFVSWEKALEAAGFDPAQVYVRKKWRPETIIKAIKDRSERREPLNGRDVYASEYQLYHSASYHFDSWRGALIAAGFTPEKSNFAKLSG